MTALSITRSRHDFHSDWNYTLTPPDTPQYPDTISSRPLRLGKPPRAG